MKQNWHNIISSSDSDYKKYIYILNLNLGGLPDRFSLIDDSRDFIFDSFLNGYWSYCSKEDMDFNAAKSFLENKDFYKSRMLQKISSISSELIHPEKSYRLPNLLELASLFSIKQHPESGHINHLFRDSSKDWHWVAPTGYPERSYSTERFRFLGEKQVGVCSSVSLCKVRGFSPAQ